MVRYPYLDHSTCLDSRSALGSIYSYIDSVPFDYSLFDLLLQKLNSKNGVQEALLIGRGISDYRNKLIDSIIKNKQSLLLENNLQFEIINSPFLRSELGNLLAKDQKIGLVWFDTGKEIKVSLRSEKNGKDVSKIAEIFGGGGHKNAAGFTMRNQNILEELTSKLT